MSFYANLSGCMTDNLHSTTNTHGEVMTSPQMCEPKIGQAYKALTYTLQSDWHITMAPRIQVVYTSDSRFLPQTCLQVFDKIQLQ